MIPIIDKHYFEATQGIDEKWFKEFNLNWYFYINRLPVHLSLTYSIVVLQNQVINGGFHQYFSNAYGQFANKTVKYLTLIGAIKSADILSKAIELVNYEKLDWELFCKRLLSQKKHKLFDGDDLFDSLDELDDKYYDTGENIEELLSNFLRGISKL